MRFPLSFLARRLHSFLGLFLLCYLCEHLLVNACAAPFLSDEGALFVRMVNKIHAIPHLRWVEILLLGLPFLLHGLWGIHYALKSRINSLGDHSGRVPYLPFYRRNSAFTWQRITSWILLVGISLHVFQMRFLHAPHSQMVDGHKVYTVMVDSDSRLAPIVQRFQGSILSHGEQMVIELPSAGASFLLVLRDTFKSPWMVLFYSMFVVAAAFHGSNGLWTACITWGIVCTRRQQSILRIVAYTLMWVLILLGLTACWGLYWAFVWS